MSESKFHRVKYNSRTKRKQRITDDVKGNRMTSCQFGGWKQVLTMIVTAYCDHERQLREFDVDLIPIGYCYN